MAPPRTATPIQLPAVFGELNDSDAEVLIFASRLACCTSAIRPELATVPAGLNAATPAAQGCVPVRETLAVALPALCWICPSVINFAAGSAGTLSSSVYPDPAEKLSASPVITTPSNRSPFAVVVVVPLLGAVPLPCALALASNEPEVATPEYSRIENRNV